MASGDRPKQCQHCGMIPVKSKTWSLIMKQDEQLAKLLKRVKELKEEIKNAGHDSEGG